MLKTIFTALLLCCIAQAQTAPATPPPMAPPSLRSPSEQAAASEIPPTAPVITLTGLCPDAPAGTDPKSPDCKTVITKAQFEKLIDTLNPKMPPQARQNVAAEYAKMLVLSAEAKKRGLENTDRYKLLLTFVKMQVAAQELIRTVQEQTKPSDAEVQKYYDDNAAKYQEISLKRIFIPRNNPTAKPTDPRPTDDELKAEGEKIKSRLAAGEDFDKIEKEIYDQKGYKVSPPPTSIPNMRRDTVPPTQTSLFDLKQGDLSAVMVEPAGAYIYKVVEKTMIPLDKVKPEIESQLGNQRLRSEMETLTSSIKPELNEAYFRNLSGPQLQPGMIGPAGAHGGAVPPHSPAQKPSTPKP